MLSLLRKLVSRLCVCGSEVGLVLCGIGVVLVVSVVVVCLLVCDFGVLVLLGCVCLWGWGMLGGHNVGVFVGYIGVACGVVVGCLVVCCCCCCVIVVVLVCIGLCWW